MPVDRFGSTIGIRIDPATSKWASTVRARKAHQRRLITTRAITKEVHPERFPDYAAVSRVGSERVYQATKRAIGVMSAVTGSAFYSIAQIYFRETASRGGNDVVTMILPGRLVVFTVFQIEDRRNRAFCQLLGLVKKC